MSNTTLQKVDSEKAIEFVPYGAADKIKLSVKIIQNMVAVPTKTGRTCSERDALRFLMLCQAQRLNPFAGDAFLVGYDSQNGPSFSLITAHQAFLKRAETCSDFEGMESGIILLNDDESGTTEREGDFHLESEKVVGGWARVHRKGRKDTYRRIRLARFNSGFAQWKVDPAGMIVKCAEADALRSTFPTLLGGLYLQGEVNEGADRIVSQMSSNRASESGKLVETVSVLPPPSEQQPEDDLGPQRETKAPAAAAKDPTKQELLQEFVMANGFTFSDLQQLGAKEDLIPGADSIASFDEVPEKIAERLLRAKTGLLQGLKQLKGVAA